MRDQRERGTLYRSRSGMILGICQGIAEYYALPVFWIRVGAIVLLITLAIWPVLLVYFIGALFIQPEPIIPCTEERDREFYGSYTNSRTMALHRLKRKFDQLQHRLHRMEDLVTSTEFTWDMKMRRK